MKLFFLSIILAIADALTGNHLVAENGNEVDILDPHSLPLLNNDFEDGLLDPWYDESPGDIHWRVEDVESSLHSPVPPLLNQGAKYLRAEGSTANQSSGLAVLRSRPLTAYPDDHVEFSFWIRSKHTDGNNLELYLIRNQSEELLVGLSSFSSVVNNEWRTVSVRIPVIVPTDLTLVLYGFCGHNAEDAIAIDDIVVYQRNPGFPTTTLSAENSTDLQITTTGTIIPSTVPTLISSSSLRTTHEATTEFSSTATSSVEITTPPICGRVFTDLSGVLQSPHFPSNYDSNLDCSYTIQVPDGYRIRLQFTNFSTEQDFDFVYVYDGAYYYYNQMLLQLSGSDLPAHTINTTLSSCFVRFTSDRSVTSSGFRATYNAFQTEGCNVNYTEPSGVIQSPNFPGIYDINLNCHYIIQVEAGKQVRLNFTDFYTTYGDYVTVYDGPDESSPVLLGPNNGYGIPNTVITTWSTCLLTFVTRSYNSGATGWRASYTSYQQPECNGTFSGRTGSIQSPNYPNNYDNRLDCYYHIQVDSDHQVRLVFSDFNIQSYYDYVTIYDGATDNSSVLQTFNPNGLPSQIYTSGPDCLVKFVARNPNSFTSSGWNASWSSVGPAGTDCLVVAESSGVLTSPNYPNSYPNNVNICWLIRVPQATQTTIHFTDFNTEYGKDVVKIYDGMNTSSPLIGRYSGGSHNDNINANSGAMLIVFSSDYIDSYSGFSASYYTSLLMTSPTGNFTSPNYPNRYPANVNMNWLINVPEASEITLTFDYFSLMNGYDFVTIYDGLNISSPLLGQFSYYVPSSITANSGSMLVVFTSSQYYYWYYNSGFSASYYTVTTTPLNIVDLTTAPSEVHSNVIETLAADNNIQNISSTSTRLLSL